MGLDIRFPIGMMFALIGGLLSLYGLVTWSDSTIYDRSLHQNVNFWWGLVLLAFGLVMLFFALWGNRARKLSGK